jgi:peptide chain release factor 1
MNKELTKKIIEYLKKLDKNEISPQISGKKKDLLLASKNEYERLEQEKKDYQELGQVTNQEEQDFLLEEIKNLEEKKEELINRVKEQIIEEEGTKQNIVIEIRPGTGGTEAGLFARDLYRMYYKFAESKNWKIEMVESKVDNEGNFTFVAFLVKGREAFRWLKNEAGIHRVQRVPQTENKGRIHTSTASVVVLPEAQDISLNIRDQDLKIDTYSSGGPGGQHANRTSSAVRITHIPTKVVATSQDGRDQRVNRERALFVLKTRLLEKLQTEKEQKVGNLRSSMIGTAERSEKIRTYNYPQNRVTDHRLGMSWSKLNFIMEGDLEELGKRLIDYEVEKKLTL